MLSLTNKFLTQRALIEVKSKTNDSRDEDQVKKTSVKELPGIFHGKQFVLALSSKTPLKVQATYRKIIVNLDGIVSYVFSPRVNFVVTDCPENYRVTQALKLEIPVISLSYIEDCNDQQSLLPYKPYVVVEPKSSINFRRGIINVEKKKCNSSTLFNIETVPLWTSDDPHIPYDDADFQILRLRLFQKDGLNIVCQLDHLVDAEERHEFRVQTITVTSEKILSRQVRLVERKFAETAFMNIYDSILMSSGKYQEVQVHNVPSFSFGHLLQRKTQNYIIDKMMNSDELSVAEQSFIEAIWAEAIGELSNVIDKPVNKFDRQMVIKAQGILKELRDSLNRESKRRLLEAEFFKLIPHTDAYVVEINTKRILAMKQNLCQLILDMLAIGESTYWNVRPSTVSKYRSLKCFIRALTPSSTEFEHVRDLIGDDFLNEEGIMNIVNIFAIRRPAEIASFESVGCNKMLFHASSPSNFIGILSRGLLMPKIVVDDIGGTRTDAGKLGAGIYFAKSPRLSLQYSHPIQASNTRLMLICEVSLGRSFETTEAMIDLKQAPDNFDSVCGIASDKSNVFEMEEYAIFSSCRQNIRYVIEFTTVSDIPRIVESIPEMDKQLRTLSSEDVISTAVKQKTIVHGLQSSSEQPMPLKAVHVRAKLLDLIAEVVVMQHFYNPMDESVEAKFVFPLDEAAAVCGFEAYINDKHVIGRIEEKQEARKIYRDAVGKGHGAYLMDEGEDVPNVFTISIGNLPPKCAVLIKLRYVTELITEQDNLTWTLPAAVAPWKKKEGLSGKTQDVTKTVESGFSSSPVEFSVYASIKMPYSIKKITCATHKLRIKKTDCQAVIFANSPLTENGFHLSMLLSEIHAPRMWVEEMEEEDLESDQRYACLLSFYPEFSAPITPTLHFTLVLDCSNSMRGSVMGEAKAIAKSIIEKIIDDRVKCTINVIRFGTDHEELYPGRRQLSGNVKKEALSFIETSNAGMGASECSSILSIIGKLSDPMSHRTGIVYFVSDGHLHQEDTIFQVLFNLRDSLRLFTFGIGESCHRHLMLKLARLGRGNAEFFNNKFRSKWNERVNAQVVKSRTAALSDITLNWIQHDSDAPIPMQAPKYITSLFRNERLLVYGFVPHCRQAELKARLEETEFATMVSTTELCQTKGKTLHFLTARALITDWDSGLLADDVIEQETQKRCRKDEIIKISKKFSIVSPFTSFVAVEERDEKERKSLNICKENEFRNFFTQVIEEENVDCLPYIEWEKSQEHQRKQLFVKFATGKTIGIDIDSETTLGQLKQKMEDKEGIPPQYQQYSSNDCLLLGDSKPIVEFGQLEVFHIAVCGKSASAETKDKRNKKKKRTSQTLSPQRVTDKKTGKSPVSRKTHGGFQPKKTHGKTDAVLQQLSSVNADLLENVEAKSIQEGEEDDDDIGFGCDFFEEAVEDSERVMSGEKRLVKVHRKDPADSLQVSIYRGSDKDYTGLRELSLLSFFEKPVTNQDRERRVSEMEQLNMEEAVERISLDESFDEEIELKKAVDEFRLSMRLAEIQCEEESEVKKIKSAMKKRPAQKYRGSMRSAESRREDEKEKQLQQVQQQQQLPQSSVFSRQGADLLEDYDCGSFLRKPPSVSTGVLDEYCWSSDAVEARETEAVGERRQQQQQKQRQEESYKEMEEESDGSEEYGFGLFDSIKSVCSDATGSLMTTECKDESEKIYTASTKPRRQENNVTFALDEPEELQSRAAFDKMEIVDQMSTRFQNTKIERPSEKHRHSSRNVILTAEPIRLCAAKTESKRSSCMSGGFNFDDSDVEELLRLCDKPSSPEPPPKEHFIPKHGKWPCIKLDKFGSEFDESAIMFLNMKSEFIKNQDDLTFIEMNKYFLHQLGVDYFVCEHILKEAGIDSFGIDGAYHLRCLFTTLLFIYVMHLHSGEIFDDFSDLIMRRPLDEVAEMEPLISYCRDTIKTYPLSSYMMELGGDWPTFVVTLLQ